MQGSVPDYPTVASSTMTKLHYSFITLSLLSTATFAGDVSSGFCDTGHLVRGAEIAVSKGCLGCHTIDNKRVGPPYREIARKYGGDFSVLPVLARKIRDGGSGNFGTLAMPPNPVTEDEAVQLAKWVLSL